MRVHSISIVADYALPMETFIVGNERSRFSYNSGEGYNNCSWAGKCVAYTVGLVFARDKEKSNGN